MKTLFEYHAEQDARAAALEKREQTCIARACLKGIQLDRWPAPGGGWVYVATQGFWDKTLNTLEDVEAWLDRIGAA